ncbi:MAG: MOSC domain-containing protein [Sulfurospirillaceae bacterium]|nr:MOSC domain-containing protein [Sulfurospirillaceae bacterium]
MEEKKLGIVKDVFSADINSSGLPRPIVEKLTLIEGYGIEHDKFAGDDLEKTVMIIGQRSYDIAFENGMSLKNGSFGENILFDFDPHELEVGVLLQVGDTIIEITQKCTLCNHLSVFGAKLPKLIKNHRGLYCKIIKGGEITKGATVSKVVA